MTLTKLKYIAAVARERHFGRAAEACFVSQPKLSVAVRGNGVRSCLLPRKRQDLTPSLSGHDAPPATMVPGIVAMALFFTASAVGPLVTPWERQARTCERLVASPAPLGSMLVGDAGAGAAFGALLALLPLIGGLALTDAAIVGPWALVAGWALGALAFATLGVLLAAPATDTPSQVMMLSNLVQLPLIFISGVFVPHDEMPGWGQWLPPLSPLSFCADLIRVGFGATPHWSVATDSAALVAFTKRV